MIYYVNADLSNISHLFTHVSSEKFDNFAVRNHMDAAKWQSMSILSTNENIFYAPIFILKNSNICITVLSYVF